MQRPKFEHIKSGAEFNHWYWLKEELVEICKRANLPVTGRKFDLRDRIMYALDHQGKIKPQPKKKKATSKFNWAKEALHCDTLITDNLSFGQNFRKFMTNEIGTSFSFNTDFMAWVKANTGKTLADAVAQWQILEKLIENPKFRSDIAANNMYNQYTRDFLDDNPGKTIKDARTCWLLKKQLPTEDGFIRYESTDLNLGK